MLTRLVARVLPVLLMLALAGCASPAAAPASAPAAPASEGEAAAALEAAPAADAAAAAESATEAPAAVTGGQEAPPVDPAASAAEATAVPLAGQTTGARRVFQIVPEQSTAQYAVEEEFFGQAVPFVTAVGITNAFAGEVALVFTGAGVAIADNKFTVDISTLTSDRPRRDRAIRQDWLESSKFPMATFVAATAVDLPADAALGRDVAFTVDGDLTIRDVTKPVAWQMVANVDGDTLRGTARTSILMRDFGFEPPAIGGMLKVTDGVSVTVSYVAKEVK